MKNKNTNTIDIDLTSLYKGRFLSLFNEFLNGSIDKSNFLVKLYSFEMKIRRIYVFDYDLHLWFRFFDNDTSATTIRNIEFDLKGSKNNYDTLMSYFKIAIEENSLQVYFS